MTIASLLLRVLARSSDSLVKFVTALDATIDKFIAENDAEIAAFEQRIADIAEDTADQIKRLEDEASEAVKEVQNEIEAKVNATKVLTGLKR